MHNKINYNIIILSTVFNTKDPIFKEDLINVLEKEGYTIHKPLSEEFGKFRVEDKRIASGKGFNILYDPNVAALFLASESSDDFYSEFEKINEIINSDLGIDMDDILRSYELIIDAKIKTKVNPQKAIDAYCNNCKSNVFDNVIKKQSKNFSINIVQKDETPNNPVWHDLLIRPLSKRHYFFKLVYRRKDLESFKQVAGRIEDFMNEIFRILTKLENEK
jgi:hypothetical protein